MPLAEDEAVEQRLVAIAEELRCLVCQNESLAGSHAPLAEDLRREIRTLIRQGRTDAEVMNYLVSRYGDFVLYRPPLKPTTWLLWGGPLILLLIWARVAGVQPAAPPEDRGRTVRRRAGEGGPSAGASVSLFLIGVVVLLGGTLLMLLRPWRARRDEHEVTAREINAGIYRDQLAELDRDRAAGTLSPADHARACDELKRRLLEDTSGAEPSPAAPPARTPRTSLLLAVVIPLAAMGVYGWLGMPAAVLPPAEQQAARIANPHEGANDQTTAQIESMVARLAARLEKNPDDAKGWAMLANSYRVLGRHAEAAKAYERMDKEVLNKDPGQLASYADTLATLAGGNIDGRPLLLVMAALKLDPGPRDVLVPGRHGRLPQWQLRRSGAALAAPAEAVAAGLTRSAVPHEDARRHRRTDVTCRAKVARAALRQPSETKPIFGEEIFSLPDVRPAARRSALLLRRPPDRFVDLADRALDLRLVELVGRVVAQHAGLDGGREHLVAERLGGDAAHAVAVLGRFPLDGRSR